MISIIVDILGKKEDYEITPDEIETSTCYDDYLMAKEFYERMGKIEREYFHDTFDLIPQEDK